MSKSRKKQKARERGQQDAPAPLEPIAPVEDDLDDEDDGEPSLALPDERPQDLSEGLFHDAIEAASRAGVMREEGDRIAYVYNGEQLSLKYVEPSDTEGAALMIAAFRRGVVFQVRDGVQVVYQPGDWEAEIRRLAVMEPVEPEDEA